MQFLLDQLIKPMALINIGKWWKEMGLRVYLQKPLITLMKGFRNIPHRLHEAKNEQYILVYTLTLD